MSIEFAFVLVCGNAELGLLKPGSERAQVI